MDIFTCIIYTVFMQVAVQHIKFQLFPSQVKDRHPYWSIAAALVTVHAAGMVEFPKDSRSSTWMFR